MDGRAAEGLHQRQAVDIRHDEVLQDERGPDAIGGRFGVGAPLAAVQLEAGHAVEQARERHADEPLIVDQQNRRAARGRRAGAGVDWSGLAMTGGSNRPDPSELERRRRWRFRQTREGACRSATRHAPGFTRAWADGN